MTHPAFLWLLLALPWLLWPARRSLADLTRRQRIVTLAVRALLLTLLVLALAGPRWRVASERLAVVFLVDQSASVSPEAGRASREFVEAALAGRRPGDSAQVVGFARGARVLDENWTLPEDRAGTDIAGALEFGEAIFPGGAARRIVLLSDGNDTQGGRIAKPEAELFTVPLRNPARPEVLIERVEAPRRARTGEPFDVAVQVRSNVETRALVKLYRDGLLAGRRDVEMSSGGSRVVFADQRVEGKFAAFEAEIVPGADTLLENNRAQATVTGRGEPRVLLIAGDESRARPLAQALRAQEIAVEVRGPGGAPEAMEDLQTADLLLITDVPVLSLTGAQMELYRTWVRDFGGGFAMLGGERSFSAGGFFKTPIEQLLPVRMEHDDRLDTPTVALLVALDRSGSMATETQGQTKMSLADQGAALALAVLGPRDYFGVLAVDTRAHVAVPLARVENREAVQAKIMSITADGGGIYIYTTLLEAFAALREVDARVKHLILFSDAADAEEKVAGEDGGTGVGGSALEVASAMASARITTSVVALGSPQDRDTDFLKTLAERGGGRFYLTSDALTLPQIFTTETMKVAQSSIVEGAFQPVAAGVSPITAGIDWAGAPGLLGYHATKPKPGAEVPLTTGSGEPLLAVWRYGLGWAGAFTSDAESRWAAEWLGWPGYGKFWAQVARGLMRSGEPSGFQVSTTEAGDRLTVRVDAVTTQGAFRNEVPVTIRQRRADGMPVEHLGVQTAPGRYATEFELTGQGTSLFSVSSPELPGGEYVFGHTRSYPREFLSMETDDEALRALGGRFDPEGDEIFTRPTRLSERRLDLTPWLLGAVLLLLPVDVFLRRRVWAEG